MTDSTTDEVHFADGFDVPDRVAFGLGAPELVAVVAAAIIGWALLHAPLPAPVAAAAAIVVALCGAALGWLRVFGRPALEWVLLAARFALTPRRPILLSGSAPLAPGGLISPTTGAAVIPLPHPRQHPESGDSRADSGDRSADRPARRRRAHGAHRITFFSLKGGTGRTALATELAGRLAAAAGTGPVALLDLDLRAASVGARLGLHGPTVVDFAMAPPDERRMLDHLTAHGSGVRVLLGAERLPAPDWPVTAPVVRETLRELDLEGFAVVLVDVAPELSPLTQTVLRSVDDVFIVVAPTASGVHDAYRTTEALRRMGLRHELRYVINRVRPDTDLSEAMRDLRGHVVAEIPDDSALTDAENRHVLAGSASTPAGHALQRFARRLDRELRWSCED